MATCSSDEGVRLRDKVTIVTGGASGIGRSCVELFGKHTHAHARTRTYTRTHARTHTFIMDTLRVLIVLILCTYGKTGLKRPLKTRKNKGLNDE